MTKTKKEDDESKQVELAANQLARILIQQVMSKKNLVVTQQIDNKYGKPNK